MKLILHAAAFVSVLAAAACSTIPQAQLVHVESHAGTTIAVHADSDLPGGMAAGIAASMGRALELLASAAPERESAGAIKVHVLSAEAFDDAYGLDTTRDLPSIGGFTRSGSSPLVALRWSETVDAPWIRRLVARDVEFAAAHEATHAWLNAMDLDAGILEEGLCHLVALRVTEVDDGVVPLNGEIYRRQAAMALEENPGRFPWDWIADGTDSSDYHLGSVLLDRVCVLGSGALPLTELTATPDDVPATRRALAEFAGRPMSEIEEDVRAWTAACVAPYREGDWARLPDGSEISLGPTLVRLPAGSARELQLDCHGNDLMARLYPSERADGTSELNIAIFAVAEIYEDDDAAERARAGTVEHHEAMTVLTRDPGDVAAHVSFTLDGDSALLARDGDVLCEIPLTGPVATVAVVCFSKRVGVRLVRPLPDRPAPDTAPPGAARTR